VNFVTTVMENALGGALGGIVTVAVVANAGNIAHRVFAAARRVKDFVAEAFRKVKASRARRNGSASEDNDKAA
jgi:hypothetical protein